MFTSEAVAGTLQSEACRFQTASLHQYHIADLAVDILSPRETLLKQGRPYLAPLTGVDCSPDIVLETDPVWVEQVRARHAHLSLDELNYIYTGFAFSRELLAFGGFCMHASAIALDGRAVLFSASCGTGKSTHAKLWQDYFGKERAVIINDDKPALRLINNTFHVYGTPWSGKNDLSTNVRVPLQAVVFIEQSKDNWIRCLDSSAAVKMLVHHSLRPQSDSGKMGRLLELLDKLLRSTEVYQMGCTISESAVEMAYAQTYNIKRAGERQ